MATSSAGGKERHDWVIKGGRLIDGVGSSWYLADVGVRGDRIVEIGRIAEQKGKKVIDASGKIVTPGFVDIHSHAERNILNDRLVKHLTAQGVSTILGGNCGGSPRDLAQFHRELEWGGGAAVNVATLVGHGMVRQAVMGPSGRAPTAGELDRMRGIVEEQMEAGALGLSTGLKYRPGVYSTTDEIVELAKVAAKHGGFYATHLRDEGHKLLESMDEAVEIGERAGLPVQMSHHKAAGADMWGRTKSTLKRMEAARRRGVDVTTDVHPYPATFTTAAILFPPWALEGSEEEIARRLSDRETRERAVDGAVWNIEHDRGGNDIRNITVACHAADRSLEGLNLAEILQRKGRPETMKAAAAFLLDLLLTGRETSCVFHCLSEEDIVRIMRHPLAMFGSDAGNAVLGKGKVHPRHYGHFPRILGRHVRDRGDLPLEEAIRKMTSVPATRMGIRDRGVVSEGKYADIVIFDYGAIRDKATFDDPHQFPEGVEVVFVNGEIVFERGEATGKRPGRILYGPGKRW